MTSSTSRPWTALVIALAVALPYFASASGPKIGEPAPPLKLSKVLQAPAGAQTDWKSLQDRVVVIDFWATWCGPCIVSIPHWNELADAFKDQPVQFVAVTDENEEVVASFLKRTPIRSWVGLTGAGQSMLAVYGIRGIPTTIIVNQKGVVAAVTHPASLEAKHIAEVIKTGVSSLPPPVDSADDDVEPVPASKPLFEISVRHSGPRLQGHGFNAWGINEAKGEVTGQYATVESAILRLFDGRASLLDRRVALPKEDYDFTVRTPNATPAERDQLLNVMFRTTFDLRVRRERAEREVLVMTVANTNAPGATPATPTSRGGGGTETGGLKLGNATFDWLPSYFEGWFGKPVFNETGVTNRYDFRLRWKMSRRELLLTAFDRAVVSVALEPDAERESRLSVGQLRYVQAIRGKLPESEFQTFSAEDRENIELFRAELAKPNKRFEPDPDAVMTAVREQFGLKLAVVRRPVELLVVESAAPVR